MKSPRKRLIAYLVRRPPAKSNAPSPLWLAAKLTAPRLPDFISQTLQCKLDTAIAEGELRSAVPNPVYLVAQLAGRHSLTNENCKRLITSICRYRDLA